MRPLDQLPAEAIAAWRSLTAGLLDLAEDGLTPPCATDPEGFMGEDREDRQHAAEVCRRSSPLLDLCASYADTAGEAWGVWGGADRSTNPSGQKATTERNAA